MPAPKRRPNHPGGKRSRLTTASVAPAAGGTRWALPIVAIAGLLSYANSIFNPFVLDDVPTIVENPYIQSLLDLSSLLVPVRELPVSGRPVVNLSFAINYAIGGLSVTTYHLWNIAVHVLCGVVLFSIVRRTLELPSLRGAFGSRSTGLAFASALLWVVHPLNSEAVDYLTQRTESMMGLCYLTTLYASVRALTEPGRRWEAAAVVACALGMGCKESMVTAPVAILLFDRIFVFGSFREAFHERARLYLGLAATWLILASLVWSGPRRRSAGFGTSITPLTYLLNQLPLITRYLQLTFWPSALVVNYGWPAALTLADVWPHAVLIALLLATTVAVLAWRPHVAFLPLWFFLTLAPASSFVPIATEVGAERRMYLPLAGLLVLVVVGVTSMWDRLSATFAAPARAAIRGRVVAGLLIAGVSSALAARTVDRNREYASPLLLAKTTLDRYPTPVAHHVLGAELIESGNRREGLAHLRMALPGAPRAHLMLGVELYNDGELDAAIAELRAFVREQPNHADVLKAHEFLGRSLARKQDFRAATAEFEEVLRLSPSNPAGEFLLAETLFAQRQYEAAAAHYRAHLGSEPANIEALNQLGIAYGFLERFDEAIVVFRRAVEVDPRSGPAQRNLATALWVQERFDEALVHARQAMSLQLGDAESYALLGRIFQSQGRRDEAAGAFEQALAVDPTLAEARNELRQLRRVR